MSEKTIKVCTVLYFFIAAIVCVLFNTPPEKVIEFSFMFIAACIALWAVIKYVLYPIIKFFFIISCGYKAAKGIIKEVRKGN